MIKRLIGAAILAALLVGSAEAQQPPVERTYTVTLGESELLFVSRLLQGQPYRDAAPVLNNIQRQLDAAKAASDAKAAADAASDAAAKAAAKADAGK